MTKKQIISLVVSIIIVITAISIWFPNRNIPFKYWFKDATNFQECSEASGVILESYPEQCVFKGKSFSNPDQHVDVPDQESKLKTFVDPQGLYSFKYPSDILTFKTEFRPIPFYTNAQQEETAIFSHTINAEYCNLAGNCKPTTTDLEISAIVVDVPLASLKKAKLGDLDPTEDLVTNTEIPATYEVTFVEMGAEGEGINYYFISLNDKQTLVISKKYLNENILTSYQNNPDFIPFFEQGRIVINIIESLKILSSQQSTSTLPGFYTNNKFGFSLNYPVESVKVKDYQPDDDRLAVATKSSCALADHLKYYGENFIGCQQIFAWVDPIVATAFGDSGQNVKIGGRNGQKFLFDVDIQDGNLGTIPVWSWMAEVEKGGYWYKFELKFHKDELQEATKLFDKTLSSFKFISPGPKPITN
jgi:hypothetical protein